MKSCLVDVNVCIALLLARHEHHSIATAWFEGLNAGESGLCRVVQLGLMRLLANRSVMGDDAMPAGRAGEMIQRLLEDERLDFINEPFDLDATFSSLLKYPFPAGKLVMDAYLAAFAISSSRQLVTLDGGFKQFRGLDLVLLS